MNPTFDGQRYLVFCVFGAVVLACSSDGDNGDTSSSSGSTAADGPAACYATCDKQGAANCPKVQSSYVADCKGFCDAAYKKVPPECKDKRVAVDVCTRDKPTYACSATGTLETTPSGACANEVLACRPCSPNAGASCFGPF